MYTAANRAYLATLLRTSVKIPHIRPGPLSAIGW